MSTEKDIAAAKTIVVAYGRRVARISLLKTKLAEERRRRVFAAFLTQSAVMQWPRPYYRLLYWGPVPHLYIVAEGIKNHLHEAKNNAKKRLNVVRHLELENVQSTLIHWQTVKLLKDAEKLHKGLFPTVNLHKFCDVEALKACTREFEALMCRRLPRISDKWQEDMFIALKGISQEKKLSKANAKPDLNVQIGTWDDMHNMDDIA
ncbi:hypothetical protein BN946_scf185001.g30 [Trametes cinnabarina]|uniref:Uncharacterized protein n=1 Tax=Pycnoporus cinnabarinus TaxID=5643 RepID=A0A060SJY9_PYCCI|nr:hypothetical protein BN946_scf185001.g30 [Trametes cinnabarina]